MKILGFMPVNADAIPKGARKPRRVTLFEPVEYDVEEAPASAAVPEAVSISHPTLFGGEWSATGWNGRLWRPRENTDPDALVRVLRRPYSENDCVDVLYDRAHTPREGRLTDLDPERNLMADFPGEILWSDRTAALARVDGVARGIAIIGGEVHLKVADPVWIAYPSVKSWRVGFRVESAPLTAGSHLFRIDRADDAWTWARERAKDRAEAPTYAWDRAMPEPRFLSLRPEFLSRDDLSNFVSSRVNGLLDAFRDLLPHVSDGTAATWRRARRRAAALSAHSDHASPDVPLPPEMPLDGMIADLAACYDAVPSTGLPTGIAKNFETVCRESYRPFADRVAFERARRPEPDLSRDDETAMSLLSCGPDR